MKLGRTCVAAALFGAAALPLAAPISWADAPGVAPPAPVAQPVQQTEAPLPPPDAPPVEISKPEPSRRVESGQVSQRPAGAPETGGGEAESGIDPVAVGGAAAALIAVGGGAVLMLRRRAGAN
jgi:hypothetical protein